MGSERSKRHLRFQDGLESRVQVDQCLSECSERPELGSLRGQRQIFRGSLCLHMHPCAFEHATRRRARSGDATTRRRARSGDWAWRALELRLKSWVSRKYVQDDEETEPVRVAQDITTKLYYMGERPHVARIYAQKVEVDENTSIFGAENDKTCSVLKTFPGRCKIVRFPVVSRRPVSGQHG